MFDWISLLLGLLLGLLLMGLIALLIYLRRQGRWMDLNTTLSRLETQKKQLEEQLLQDEAQAQKIQQLFEQKARQVLDQNASRWTDQSQNALDSLLTPLKERLSDFSQKVESVYRDEARERFHLRKEIESLVSLNQQMSEEARSLTRALKGDAKKQGNWGELVLTRVLEGSGLREGEEFVVQAKELQLTSADGRRLQPDVVVRLPDQKHLIVDAKVSLTAYERFMDAEEEPARQLALKQHVQSVTTHILQLGEKHYSSLNGLHSPDFVLLFMPIEPAFSAAVQYKPDLFSYAWERKIVLVSPTTLLATLKTVASLWKLERQNTNAKEIALQGGRLYDKFVGFVEEMDKIGQHIDRSQRTYNNAMLKLRDGNGNLIRRAEQLRDLGVPNKKNLP